MRLSRENLGSNAAAIAEYLQLTSTERAITALPFHYSYGMSVINSHLAVGATLLLTDESVASPKFWEFFAKQGATSVAGVPYTFDLLDRIGFRDKDLPKLRYITQAGGRLAAEKVRAYAQWAKDRGVRFYVMYGQTEAAPRMSYVPPEMLPENPDCIGRPIPGGKFKIINELGEQLDAPHEAGELVYEGPNVMMGYALSRSDLSRGRDGDQLRTGDLAVRNEAGLYRVTGRMSRFLKVFGLRIGLDDVETFLSENGIRAVAAGDDQRMVVCTLDKDRNDFIVSLLTGRYALSPSAIVVVERAEYPILASGKIDYRTISTVAAEVQAKAVAKHTQSGTKVDLRDAYRWALGKQSIREDDSFETLDGDSLSYVEVSLAIEKYLGYLPELWEQMPIARIEALGIKAQPAPSLQTDIVVRVVAILGVICGHVTLWETQGGSDVLLILAGYSFARFHRSRMFAGAPAPAVVQYLWNVIVPYYLIVFGYMVYNSEHFDPKTLILIATVYYQPDYLPYLWFLQVLFHSVLLYCALFLIGPFRNWAKADPWTSGCVVFLLGVVLSLAASHVNIPGLYNRYSAERFFLFAFGWCFYFSRSPREKWIMTAFAVALFFAIFLPTPHWTPRGIWVLLATALMLWVERIPIPRGLHAVVSAIAAASFYIYIAQRVPLMELEYMSGNEIEQLSAWWRLPDIVAQSVLLGLGLWWLVRIVNRGTAIAYSYVQAAVQGAR